MRFHGNFLLQRVRQEQFFLFFLNHFRTNILWDFSKLCIHLPGALTADQHNMGDSIHSTESTKYTFMNIHTLHNTDYYQMYGCYHHRVRLTMMPSTQPGFAERNTWQVGCEKQRHGWLYTQWHKYKPAHTVYSHKCEYGHDGCGDEELRSQNQIHLKKQTQDTTKTHYTLKLLVSAELFSLWVS